MTRSCPFDLVIYASLVTTMVTGQRSHSMIMVQVLGYPKSPREIEDPLQAVKKRTRRSHPKVRTGCITCKIRRKKCDETKPECHRCTSTGRRCDGYNSNEMDRVSVAGSDTLEPAGTLTSQDIVFDMGSTVQVSSDTSSGPSNSLIAGHSYITSSDLSAYEYNGDPPTDWSGLALQRNRTVRPPNIFPSAYTVTDLGNHCFSYFRHHTGPQLTSYFASTIWQRYCTSIGLFHPVVFACAAAVGAVHRRFNLGISAEAFEWCAHSNRLVKDARRLLATFEEDVRSQNFLLNSVSPAAKSKLCVGVSGYGIDNHDILMAAHMLLFHFGSFQADFSAAVFDLKIGIRCLLERPMKLLHSRTSYSSTYDDPDVLAKFFDRIKVRARQLFGSREHIIEPPLNNSSKNLSPIPVRFHSLEEARDCVFTEACWILHTPDHVWSSKLSRVTARTLHMSRLVRWSAAYAETIIFMDRTESEKRAGGLLKVTRSFAYLLLWFALHLTARGPGQITAISDGQSDADAVAGGTGARESSRNCTPNSETESKEANVNATGWTRASAIPRSSLWSLVPQREDLMSKFYRLQIWADMVVDPTNPFYHVEHSVSFDSGVGAPLSPLPEPQSSGKTRFQVKYVMDRSGDDCENPEVSEHLGFYGLAEQSSAIEEHAVFEVLQSRLPPGTDLKWVDVTLFAEDRRIMIQYCCNGPEELDQKPKWVQEWWVF